MNATLEQSMESARTITHLAAANQQLATAHNIALGHVQCLLNELRKKPDRTRTSCPSCGRKDNCARSAGKLRVLATKQFNVLKPTNRKLRKLKKLPAFDESKDAEISAGSSGEEAEESERLKEAMEELRAFKSESQTRNDKLTRDLERQTLLIERLSRDFKESQSECERKERSLEEARERLSRAELESARILALFETFQCERREQAEERRKQFQVIDELTQQIRGLEAAVQDGNQLRQRKVPSDPAPGAEEASSRLEGETEEGQAEQQDSGRNEQFKKELILKREARQRAIAAISAEMERLRRELEAERLGHAETGRTLEELREELRERSTGSKRLEHLEAVRLLDLLKLSDELASNLLLQLERTDDLRFQLESEPEEHRQRIGLLRRIAEETRTSLECRKRETGLLKDRLAQILVRLGEERDLLDRPDDVRRETERQLEDIARSRILCDERSRILAELKEHSAKQIHELKLKLGSLSQDNQSLEEDLRKTEDKMDAQDSEILNLESQLGLAKADCRDLQNQMSLINSLFTQMLLSASSAEMDLDRLTQLLQENHDLICGMARESGTEAAALPKLLLDIVEQVDGRDRDAEEKEEEELLQEKNIAHNLPKVWRVLLELLSCQVAGTNPAAVAAAVAGGSSSSGAGDEAGESTPDSCYKSVDTPSGPRLVISVSKTYIRLKELILEKKHLEKEMNRMKQLNSHLESKLSEQEKRLSTVSAELSKTWNIVGRMEAQHQQLHTHEKILRYELQQKRKMLQELKQELEYCREKWESARQKNTNTEIEWKSLRREFAARKALVTHASSFSNSGESGFSDDREESDEDERDVGKSRPRHVTSRRRSKKDDARPNSPDTESTTEQPTDAELSESKTASSSGSASRQHTPARESESQSEDCQDIIPDEASTAAESNEAQNPEAEILDPLDKALVRVIENLLDTQEASEAGGSSTSVAVEAGPSKNAESAINGESIKEEIEERKEEEEAASVGSVQTVASASNIEEPSVTPRTAGSVSIFSIGPIPALEARRSPEAGRLPFVFDLSSGCPGETAKPSTSSTTSQVEASTSSGQPQEDVVLDARAARLKSLEEQARWLVRKVNDTNRRGSALSSRLEELHETYGSAPAAPPMPDVLPTFRLRTATAESEDDAEPAADETTEA